jgi:Putative zinc-finger
MSGTFRCDDKDMLVGYLYGEIDVDGRREVERHLRTCSACARETEALESVRQNLAAWLPPEPDLGFVISQKPANVLRSNRWAALGALPAWMQVAAAVLVMAAGAAIANLQVQYGIDGFTVRTGWMAPAQVGAPPSAPTPSPDESWRPALASLEQTLRGEMTQARESSVAATATRSENTVDGAALMRRVEALVNASEQRQRDELALRLTMAQRDWDIQRRGDMVRIQQSIGGLTGRAVRTEVGQQEMMNLLRRVSSQPIP